MLKNILVLLVIALFMSPSFAKGEKIAIVDIAKVVSVADAAEDVRKKIKKKRDKYQSDITKQEDELRDLDKKLAEQRGILAKDAFEKKKSEFQDRFIKVQRDVQIKRSKLDDLLKQSLSEINDAVLDIITDIAKDKDLTLVLQASQVLYAEKSMDITDEVLKKLNKKLPKIDLKTD